MRGECEENEEMAVNCAPCTAALDLTGLPVGQQARDMLVIFLFGFPMTYFFQRCLCFVQTTTAPSPPTIPQNGNVSTTSPTSNGRLTSFDVGAGKFYFILLQTQSHALFLAAGMGNEDGDNEVDYLLSNDTKGGHDRPLEP
jgi:hypothetical protein